MRKLNERQRNNKRHSRLDENKKEVLNWITLEEFKKPVIARRSAVELLDMIEF